MADFSKILIANRGEIVLRICRTASLMGYKTVAVFSDADVGSLHVNAADQAVRIGAAPVTASYLNMDAILEAAEKTGADAIHPGYGFLAENQTFAEACEKRGIVFIGPGKDAIRMMGNKQEAKEHLLKSGISCIPGYQGEDQSDRQLVAESENIGFPLMVKAVAGGGGKGMRLVNESSGFLEAIASARSEAKNAFGNGDLLLEKAIVDARHVEIQIFADAQGNTIHLGERDCSIQRRHQKVVEESPSPVVDDALRQKMGQVAIEVAQSVNYLGAGTVEFLLDSSGQFYFLEMNTRLQVEHPVTEFVTGLDLVELQLRVAAGKTLGITQEQVEINGHAMEVRLYAEDPADGFLPQTGKVLTWKTPSGEGIRVDHGVQNGDHITPYYDPMLAKVICHGPDRDSCLRKLRTAIEKTVLLGVKSNQSFLSQILKHRDFKENRITTDFIGEHFPDESLCRSSQFSDLSLRLAALLIRLKGSSSSSLDDWQSANRSTNSFKLEGSEEQKTVSLVSLGSSNYAITIDEITTEFALEELTDSHIHIEQNGILEKFPYAIEGEMIFLSIEGEQYVYDNITLRAPIQKDVVGAGGSFAVMEGAIVAVMIEEGQVVEKGDTLVLMEAMKMEHPIRAGISGVVSSVLVGLGQQVKSKQLLVEIKENEATK